MTSERFTVEHRPEQSRYVLLDHGEEGGAGEEIGEERYVDVDNERVLFHTLVSDAYAGQGLASTLVRAVVDDVIGSGMSIVPVCPYVTAWLPKHPEYSSHVARRRPHHLAAIGTQQG